MVISRPTRAAYKLLHDGAIALANVEAAGIRIDTDYLAVAIDGLTSEINDLEKQVRGDREVYQAWSKKYGDKLKIGSRDQLADILFNVLGFPCYERTETGRPKADEKAFETVDLPFVTTYLRMEKLKKARGTYLLGIQREMTQAGFLHCFYNLHIARSYRSSSDAINFQNQPIRDQEIAKWIRQSFIPRYKGWAITEIDYGQIEVRVSQCYHHDPVMKAYIEDKSKDMHRDMAAQLYIVRPEQVSKAMRHAAKNQFVFPQFYGSYYIQCAPHLWQSMKRGKFEVDGVLLKKLLRRHGIKSLGDCDPDSRPRPGTFESHVQEVECDFWNRRFSVYNQWKKDWYAEYLRNGYVWMHTGFIVSGIYSRNDVINYPVQGAAFHCLLWSLIRLQKWLRKHKFKTRIIGQIHDSLLLDGPLTELQDVLAAAHRIMTIELRKAWKWIVVPLEIEAESSDVNWWEKREVKIAA